MHCTLPELLFHVKNAPLETACAEALRELEMDRVSWPILEDHMKNTTFPTIRMLPCHAHGGMTTKELKAHTMDSWLFHLKVDAGSLFSILLQLAGSAKKAGAWWKDCEVEANTKEHIQCNTWEVEEHIQSKGLISKFKRENTKMSRK